MLPREELTMYLEFLKKILDEDGTPSVNFTKDEKKMLKLMRTVNKQVAVKYQDIVGNRVKYHYGTEGKKEFDKVPTYEIVVEKKLFKDALLEYIITYHKQGSKPKTFVYKTKNIEAKQPDVFKKVLERLKVLVKTFE